MEPSHGNLRINPSISAWLLTKLIHLGESVKEAQHVGSVDIPGLSSLARRFSRTDIEEF